MQGFLKRLLHDHEWVNADSDHRRCRLCGRKQYFAVYEVRGSKHIGNWKSYVWN